MRNSNQVNQDKMKVINLPRKLIVIVNLFSSGLCSINCSFNCKSFWILMIIFKCLVSTIVSTTSTPFSWSLDEDKRFYLPTNYYPIYRNLRSHQVGLSSSSSNSHLLSSSSFSNYHSHPSSSSHGSSIHDARFDETSVDSEDETNYDDSNGADDVNDDDNSGNGGDVVNGQDEENDDSMMMMNEGVERDVIGLDGGESGNGLKEIIENSISNSENELIILSRGRGLPKGSITMSQESILSYIDRISRGDWCRFHGHVADDSIRNLPSTSSSSSSSSPSSGLPLSPSSSSSLYEIDSTNQITFSSKLQMPSGSVPSSVTSSASSHPKKQSIPSHPLVYASSPLHEIPPHSLRLKYNQTAARVDLLNAILHDYKSQTDNYRFLKKSFHHMIDLDKDIIHAKIIWLNEQNINTDISKLNQQSSSSLIPTSITINHNIKPTYYYTTTKRKRPLNTYTYLNINRTISPFEPWLDFQFKSIEQEKLFDQLLTQQYILRSQLSSFQQPIDLNNNNDNPKPSSANLPIPTNNNNNNNNLSSSSSPSSSNNQNDHHNSNDNKKATNSNNLNSSSNTKKIMINNKNKSNMMSNNNSNKNDPNNNNDHSNNNNKCPKFTSWTNAYYSCDYKIWLFSYTSLIIMETADSCILRGIISVDIDINSIDINQCDYQPSFMTIMETIKSTLTTEPTTSSSSLSSLSATTTTTTTGTTSSTLSTESSINKPSSQSTSTSTINLITIPLIGTNKCHQPSSKCTFQPGHGWTKGGYECRCRDGYFAPSASFTKDKTKSSQSFNGTEVEKAWNEKLTNQGSVQYDMIYVCQKCQPGCDTCKDNSPCLSSYNWAFRISLLTFSVICIFLTTMLACYIYKYRKLKVFKVASPIFLCITLLGCAIMYLEMAAIFPVLTTAACIATKTTRHMGFCLTYSALLLKTWRVSLTYRVKSAHKLKLTDKQLLQWLFPILMIMAIYLGTWTISAPPQSIYIYDWNNLKFKICEYNWWDHSLAIMESCFLLWGVKVCYNVRNAESFFNEAKYICWAIYNISAVNVTMICIHLILLPKAGPDGKYFFGFIRTQLSTTTTIAFIFGPKFYRVIKGQGDAWDNRVRARGINASFSLNGVGLVHEETHDLYQENEELKEEIHKLATQIELMKLMQMEINNRHLKPKHLLASGHHHILPTVTITANPASTGSVTQSPIVKACYSRFEANDAPSPRISPAAELASERV